MVGVSKPNRQFAARNNSGSGREPQHVATSSERIQETLASLAEIYRELLQAGSRGM